VADIPLNHVALPVEVAVVNHRLLPVSPSRNARHRSAAQYRAAVRRRIVTLVRYHRVRVRDQPRQLRAVHRLAQRVQPRVDLAADSAAAPAQRLGRLTADERKTLRERLKERREERQKEAPMLPAATAPAQPAKPAAPPPKAEPKPAAVARTESSVAQLLDRASAKFDVIADYECRLVRREVVGGSETSTEEVLFQFRKSPFSVHMLNVGAAGKGREVVYVQGKYDGKMHVVTGEGDSRLMPAGFKTSLKPDSPLATGKSRHKITEAGFGNMIARLRAAEQAGRIAPLPAAGRKEFTKPVPGVEVTLRPGDDANLPRGGKQRVFFDADAQSPGFGLPCLSIALDEAGREVEYYLFDRVKAPANLADAVFDPAKLGKK
jgi:hypothetical protein